MKCVNGNSSDLLKIYFERFKKRQFVGQSKKSSKGLKSFLRFVNDHVLIFNETHWDGALWRAGFMEKFPVPLHFSQVLYKNITTQMLQRERVYKPGYQTELGVCSTWYIMDVRQHLHG